MDDTLFTALETWIMTACPDIQAVTQEQEGDADEPRPPLPYACIFFRSDVGQAGTTHHYTSNVPGTVDDQKVNQVHTMPRRKTLVVDLFGGDPMALAAALEVSPNLPDIQEQFLAAGIAVSYAGGIGDTTKLRSTRWEPSAQVEFFLKQNQKTTVEVPWVDTMQFDLDVKETP